MDAKTSVIETAKIHLRDFDVVTVPLIQNKVRYLNEVLFLNLSDEEVESIEGELIRHYSRWIPA